MTASGGHLSVLEVRDVPGIVISVLRRHLMVTWKYYNEGCPLDSSTCSMAASAGHLSVLQWARSER